jgi:plasmid maintenance system killer protein
VKSVQTEEYHTLFAQLPNDVQKQASKANRLFEEDPYYPSLHFKCINKEKSWYSVRINKNYRAVGTKEGDTVLWFFIGTHADYDRILRS